MAEKENISKQTTNENLSCNPVCEILSKAGVPPDLNWRGTINFLRELENDPRYSAEQKKQFHTCFTDIIKEKNFSPAKLREVNFRIEYIKHIYCLERENAFKKQLDMKEKLLDNLLNTYTAIIEDGLKSASEKMDDVGKLKDTTVQAIQSDDDKEAIIQKVTKAAGNILDKIVRESMELKQKAGEADKWKQKAKAMEHLATIDQLTQLYNRRAFDEYFNEMLKDIKEHAKPLSLIMFDIDHFKKFNDNYGHDIGDEVLRLVASLIKKNANRDGDFTARYGGEEMVVVCEDLNLEKAGALAETIRKDIEEYQFIIRGPEIKDVKITISAGVAELSTEWSSLPEEEFGQLPKDDVKAGIFKMKTKLFKAADTALYRAKNNGRNCVCVFEQQ